MLEKTKEVKVLRDAIHGYIHVNLQIIWDLINAKEFQRLRRVNQLGGVYQVYHNAEHSRFSHSLGVYEIVRRMVYEIDDLDEQLTAYEKATVMIAALLHDVGHMPFSHAFEFVSPINHEEFSRKIILGDTQIHQILKKENENLPLDVADIISYKHKNKLLNQIVSGQLDADRMDYLLRDAYFTGTSYGKFDLERILRTIRVKDNNIVVKESGIHSVEDYIMARYHMYWQVYYHPVARGFEVLLRLAISRMKFLYEHKPEMFFDLQMFIPFLRGNPTIHDHFMLDEHAAYYGFGLCIHKEDKILSDLCERILDRKILECEVIENDNEVEKVIEKVREKGYDPTYYVLVETATKSPYQPYEGKDGHNIYVLTKEYEVEELSENSVIVNSLVNGDVKEDKRVFFQN